MKIIDKLCDHLIRLFNLAKSRLESRGSYTPPKNQVAPPSPPMKVWSMYGNAPCQDTRLTHHSNIKPQESQSVTLAHNSEIVFTTSKEDTCVGYCSCKSKAKKKTSKKTPKKSIKKALLTKKTQPNHDKNTDL